MDTSYFLFEVETNYSTWRLAVPDANQGEALALQQAASRAAAFLNDGELTPFFKAVRYVGRVIVCQ